jgi:macrolide transport system ATP-binding/permease protein
MIRPLSRRQRAARASVAPSGMTARDLANESIAGLFARPGRMVLTVIGLGALVATLGLSRTAGNRIVTRFDELAATEIVVSRKPSATGWLTPALPWDAPARLGRLNGVVAAGTLSTVAVGSRLVAASPVNDPQHPTRFKLTVSAASPRSVPRRARHAPHRRADRRRSRWPRRPPGRARAQRR